MIVKPDYIFPRIGILNIQKVHIIDSLLNNIQSYHGKYFQLFNLTNTSILNHQKAKLHQIKFKWRGTPFSLTQAIRILNKLDLFLRTNFGNSVIFCVNHDDAYLFALVLIRQYVKICNWGTSWQQKNLTLSYKLNKFQPLITLQQPYFSQTFIQTYQQKQISSPPVKIICSLQVSTPNFIPIFQIYQQARYNDFELVYSHEIANELAEYYFNLSKPLQQDKKSIGSKYYDRKPQTKYLKRPVNVCGDVKIVCYSYNTLQKKKQFQFGFCTKKLLFSQQFGDNQGILTFKYHDLFDRQINSNNKLTQKQEIKLFDQNIKIYVKIQNWCSNQQCATQSKCQDCHQHTKKLNLRYNQIQSELNKLHRQRTSQQVSQQLSIS